MIVSSPSSSVFVPKPAITALSHIKCALATFFLVFRLILQCRKNNLLRFSDCLLHPDPESI